jgi:hypothetical protein
MSPSIAALVLMAQAPQDFAGLYRTHQMEVGAALELKADGTFRYELDYGAVSEGAEGHWTMKANAVHLTSEPLPIDLLVQIERSDARFEDQVLDVRDGALVMQRWDTVFTFTRDDE